MGVAITFSMTIRPGPPVWRSICLQEMCTGSQRQRLLASALCRRCADRLLARCCVTHATSCSPGCWAATPVLPAGLLLVGAASATARARERQHIDVVWTGPETGTGTGRLTAAVITDLIGQARRELLLVTYASNNEPAIEAALAAAAERGVQITLLAERHDDNPAYTAIGTPFPGLPAVRLRWPASQRPHGAALHAKIVVVDDDIALVGSANFTSRAMASNLECGILIRGGPQPRAIRRHVDELWERGHLQRS